MPPAWFRNARGAFRPDARRNSFARAGKSGMTVNLVESPASALADEALFLEELRELARFVHFHHDVGAADEFALHIELGDCRPIGERLDPLAHTLILEHVDAFEIDVEVVEDGDSTAGKAALREQRAALHEQQHITLADQIGNTGLGVVGHFNYSYSGTAVVSCRGWSPPPLRPPNAA